MSDCRVCGRTDEDRPQIFSGEEFCCDRHRKIIRGEIQPTPEERALIEARGELVMWSEPTEFTR